MAYDFSIGSLGGVSQFENVLHNPGCYHRAYIEFNLPKVITFCSQLKKINRLSWITNVPGASQVLLGSILGISNVSPRLRLWMRNSPLLPLFPAAWGDKENCGLHLEGWRYTLTVSAQNFNPGVCQASGLQSVRRECLSVSLLPMSWVFSKIICVEHFFNLYTTK